MNSKAFHLNLLKATEHVSSSPIRLRVIAPLLAFFAIIGMIVWWGSLFAQELIIKSHTDAIVAENTKKANDETNAKKIQDDYVEMTARLSQLKGYTASVRHIGPALTQLAEEFPMDLQLISLALNPPPAQNLTQKRSKVLLRGPTNTVEQQTFTLVGRTLKPDLVQRDLLTTFRQEALAPLSAGAQPKDFDIRPETGGNAAAKGGSPTMKFTVDYSLPARSFVLEQKGAKK